jgi:hypothetical protein
VLGMRGRVADGWEVRAAAVAAARAWRVGLAPVVVGARLIGRPTRQNY